MGVCQRGRAGGWSAGYTAAHIFTVGPQQDVWHPGAWGASTAGVRGGVGGGADATGHELQLQSLLRTLLQL